MGPPSGRKTQRLLTVKVGSSVNYRACLIEIDPALFDDTIDRVNITLPKRVLRRLDDLADARHQSRGAFSLRI